MGKNVNDGYTLDDVAPESADGHAATPYKYRGALGPARLIHHNLDPIKQGANAVKLLTTCVVEWNGEPVNETIVSQMPCDQFMYVLDRVLAYAGPKKSDADSEPDAEADAKNS